MPAITAETETNERSTATIDRHRILEIGHAFKSAKVLLSAVELGVFTALAKGPRDLDTLTAEVGIAGRGARDFFDSLVALEAHRAGRRRLLPQYAGGGLAISTGRSQATSEESSITSIYGDIPIGIS